MSVRVILLVFCGLLLGSCKKQDIPSGTTITATGFVIDSVHNKHLPGVTLYLMGATQALELRYNIGPLDTIKTDSAGNFSLRYVADGSVVDYALQVGNPEDNFYPQANYAVDYTHLFYPFNGRRSLSGMAISARGFGYARVNLRVDNNPYDTMDVFVGAPGLEQGFWFVGTSVDTTLLVPVLPLEDNLLSYQIYATALRDSATGFQRIATDTIRPGATDTPLVSRHFVSAYDISLQPK